MGQIDMPTMRKIVDALAARVADLEIYARTLQVTLAKNNIIAPKFGSKDDDAKSG